MFFWNETGTEGPVPSVHDSRHTRPDGSWSYDGLNPLKNGDILTIFNDASKKKVLWSGKIDLDPKCHLYQQGVDQKKWIEWLESEKPATLQKAPTSSV